MNSTMIKSEDIYTTSEVQRPDGEVRVSGAKNSATRLITAALLSDQKSVINNFPTTIVDANHKISFITANGGKTKLDHDRKIFTIDPKNFKVDPANGLDLPVRTTYLLAAGQLLRGNSAIIPMPGGCNIGERKIDLHLMLWEKLGLKITEKADYLLLEADELIGAHIDFPFPTIGGTENAILCGCIAKGVTKITNAYLSPEVMDMVNMLKNMGAKIETTGNSYIEIEGGVPLSGASYSVMPDRIEALTWLIYGVLSRGSIKISNVPFEDMVVPLTHIRNCGIDFYRNSDSIFINPRCYPEGVQPFQLACGTHPGVISDMQPFYTLLALKAKGKSMIVDYRYPERVTYLEELQKCLPEEVIRFNKNGYIYIDGAEAITGNELISTDLRGSMAMILFALTSEQKIVVRDIKKALRGYDDFFKKLKGLGVETTVE